MENNEVAVLQDNKSQTRWGNWLFDSTSRVLEHTQLHYWVDATHITREGLVAELEHLTEKPWFAEDGECLSFIQAYLSIARQNSQPA